MDITKKVIELVRPQYNKLNCWIHFWPHITDVVKNSETLAMLEKTNPLPCIIAAYCHDLGRVEEERRKLEEASPLPHALLSIEPTVKVLQEIGISGVNFNEIIEAVAIHSYRIYEGKNNVTKILQDADKLTGFGPRGFLDIVRYFGGKDYVDSKEIIRNMENKDEIKRLSEITLNQIEGGQVLEGVIRGLDIKLEWIDMFHTRYARELAQEGYDFFIKTKDFLIKKTKMSL